MDFVYLVVSLVCVVYLVALFFIVIGDCDLVLAFKEKFGKPTTVLAGKVVWITGASSGIGEHLAYELAKAGCHLVLSARRVTELQRVKSQCLLHQRNVRDENIMVLEFDALKYDSHKDAVEKVLSKFTKIDILVNNAGRTQRADWVKTELAVDQEMLELNVLGVLSLSKQVLPHMFERHEGHIVNMSSIAGKVGAPQSGSYTGAKHAIQGWFDSLRIEAYEKNVSVTNICPGPVFSNLLEVAFTDKKGKELNGKMNANEKRITTTRCAQLCSVAIANKLDEVWISNNPILMLTYLHQYLPVLANMVMTRMGVKAIRKIREGQN